MGNALEKSEEELLLSLRLPPHRSRLRAGFGTLAAASGCRDGHQAESLTPLLMLTKISKTLTSIKDIIPYAAD